VPLELWLVGCSQSYSFFSVTHKNFLAYYMCGILNFSGKNIKNSTNLVWIEARELKFWMNTLYYEVFKV
jgi:hypothetical protein